MADALNDLCGQIGLDMRNDEFCIEWMSEATKYCTLFLGEYPYKKHHWAENKTMDLNRMTAMRGRGADTYWGLHPNHLTLGQCAALMSKYSGPVDDMIAQTMVASLLGRLALALIFCLVSCVAWVSMFAVMRHIFFDLWVRLLRLRYVPRRQFFKLLFTGDPILLDVMNNDLRSLHKKPRPKCDCQNHLVKIGVMYTRQLPRVLDIKAKAKTLVMRMSEPEDLMRLLACKYDRTTDDFQHQRMLCRLDPDHQLDTIRKALHFLGEDCIQVHVIIVCLDQAPTLGEIEPDAHEHDDVVAEALLAQPTPRRAGAVRRVGSVGDGLHVRHPVIRKRPRPMGPSGRNALNVPDVEPSPSTNRSVRRGQRPSPPSPRFRNY